MIPKTIKQIFESTERLKEKGWEYTFQVDIFFYEYIPFL